MRSLNLFGAWVLPVSVLLVVGFLSERGEEKKRNIEIFIKQETQWGFYIII